MIATTAPVLTAVLAGYTTYKVGKYLSRRSRLFKAKKSTTSHQPTNELEPIMDRPPSLLAIRFAASKPRSNSRRSLHRS